MSRMSTFPRRPPSEQLCDLHVYKVPLDLWRAPLNNILNQSVTDTVSLGIIRVPPDLSLLDIRMEIEKQLEDQAPKDYVFLRSVGRSITRVKTRQEYEWTAKHFLPPKHYAPELYLLESTPELRDALAASERSSQLSPRGSPGARSYRDSYRYGYRQAYPDESRSRQRPEEKTSPSRHQHQQPHYYSPLPRIKPTTPSSQSRPGSPEEAFLTEVQTHRQHHPHTTDRNSGRLDYRAANKEREHEEEEEDEDPRSGYRGHKQASPRNPRQQQQQAEVYEVRSTDASPAPLEYESRRSPSPQRKAGGGGNNSYRASNGFQREAAYTNDTNEDSGVAGMSPDSQVKHRDPHHGDRSRDGRRYQREEDEEEKRRQEEQWTREEEERRRRAQEEEEELQQQRRREEEEEEEDRRREEEERRRREEEEEERRRREEEEERRRREEEDERRRREEEEEEEEERRRRREEEERRRRREEEEEARLKAASDEDNQRHTRTSEERDGERDTESAQQQRQEEQRRLLAELQEARDSRQTTEKSREDLVKKAKTLQTRTQNKRNQARHVWKKKYFEEKKKTPPLEDRTNRLREELDALHRKMMAALEGPRDKNLRTGDNRPSQKNNYIIQCTRLQHDIDDLKRRVENAKMKLTAEMKLRSQAVGEARVLREEVTRQKIQLTQTRSQQMAALSPWYGATPVPSISPQSREEEAHNHQETTSVSSSLLSPSDQ